MNFKIDLFINKFNYMLFMVLIVDMVKFKEYSLFYQILGVEKDASFKESYLLYRFFDSYASSSDEIKQIINKKISQYFDCKFWLKLNNLSKKYVYKKHQGITEILKEFIKELKLNKFIPNIIIMHPSVFDGLARELDFINNAISADGMKIFDIPFYEIDFFPENFLMVFDKSSIKIVEYKMGTGEIGYKILEHAFLSTAYPSVLCENSVISGIIPMEVYK